MCYQWEDSIEACQNCSYVDFQKAIRASCNIEPGRWNQQTIPQLAQRPPNAGHPQSSKHDAWENMNTNMRVRNRGVQIRQPAEQQEPPSSSSLNSRTDWARRCRPKRSHQDLPSAPGRHARTDPTGNHGHQGSSRNFSQKHPRAEDEETGEVTAGMNKIPPPCWDDEQFILPLVQEQLQNEKFSESQEQRLAEIWGPYERERQALAASNTPEMEEMWTPEFEEEEILEREIPLEEKIGARSVHDGGVWMRSIMNENDTWPHGPSAKEEIWTRENGGMLTSPRLKKILRIQTLQASWEEERHERSDEKVRASHQGPFIFKREERDEVTPSFSECDTSADYPP